MTNDEADAIAVIFIQCRDRNQIPQMALDAIGLAALREPLPNGERRDLFGMLHRAAQRAIKAHETKAISPGKRLQSDEATQ